MVTKNNFMKYILIIVLAFLSFNTSAQKLDTQDICMPYNVAKKITQDLLIGDSTKDMLLFTIDELEITKGKLSYKDSLLNNCESEKVNLTAQARNEKEQKEKYILMYEDCKKEYNTLVKKTKWYRAKKTFVDIVYTTAIITLMFFVTK